MLQENFNSAIQLSGTHLKMSDEQSGPSNTDVQFGNEPSYPLNMKSASAEQDTTRALAVTQSMICRHLWKPYQCSWYTDVATVQDKNVNLRSSESEHSGVSKHKYLFLINNSELFPNKNKTKSYNASKYIGESVKKPNDKAAEAVGIVGHIPEPNVLESVSSQNVEERTRLVKEIQLELVKWRQNVSNAQTLHYDGKMCIPNLRKGRTDSKKCHQYKAVSDDLSASNSKCDDPHWRQQEVPDTINNSSSGGQCK
jgi:hypothetical protein